ncbi:MAG: phosphoribosylamine--glycine ligase [Candidatus Fluviicola riflensis]|nr:MAG: phosphoribosylamine--glycine ligase [Candidatus Fluviicola riflensis]OGS78310.1 MAG: phosphoribosylamine--glycine ligase [Candidatus Fluviicola riflensis]OGS85376.1 MAG: phosphoribosylamine--glycine ligase [Fluviicola sp. RIFCSPHIGHO2_01_FULL_43_53]OGS87418.1 MAG: phosphoribosylamine--glycine ligase [Fluviicola sp. RIFCSPHIGHO2_12_FULL_43_24]
MRVLLLGSGGREHAIAWKLAKSSQLEHLFIAPGNAGTRLHGTNVPIQATDFEAIKAFVLAESVNMVVVGPEDPLVQGIQDFFLADPELKSVPVIGPSKEAAQLEGSKDFAKIFMMRHNIPTAKYATFTKDTLEKGYTFLENMKAPYVLKADGLAAGKGVLIINDLKEAKAELKAMLADAKFGDASSRVVIEQFLSGVECSVFVITDGDSYKILPEAKDYKRIGEGDQGLNTGGMGAVSPVPFVDKTFMDKIENQIIIPTVKGLKADGILYKGFIFFGLINVKGEPYVIEYNCRMGDPETEVVMPRLKSDLLDLLEGVATNTLSECDIQFEERSACTVMMVAGGYPEEYEKGKTITGLNGITESLVFHAGTASDGPVVLSNGGRVVAVTSYGKNLEIALERSYRSIEKISFDGAYYRKDIGFDVR